MSILPIVGATHSYDGYGFRYIISTMLSYKIPSHTNNEWRYLLNNLALLVLSLLWCRRLEYTVGVLVILLIRLESHTLYSVRHICPIQLYNNDPTHYARV